MIRTKHSDNRLSRREILRAGAAMSTVGILGSLVKCNYPTQSIEAYDPWDFPGGESRKEYIAAKAAILAASPHNSQPWLFAITPAYIEIHADLTKSLKSIDSFHREMYIGLGCALENCVIAARSIGLDPAVEYFPAQSDETHIATIKFHIERSSTDPLYPAISYRHTNRGYYMQSPAPAALTPALERQIDSDLSVKLTLIDNRVAMKELKKQLVEATKAIIDDKEMYEDSDAWWRQNKNDINTHRNGLSFDANVTSAGTRFFGKIGPQASIELSAKFWLESIEQEATTGSAFGILSTPDRYSRREQVECGRVWQRIALWAQANGMATQPQNQLAERWDREDQKSLTPHFQEKLKAWITNDNNGAQMVFRIGYAKDKVLKAPRRPLDWVLIEA